MQMSIKDEAIRSATACEYNFHFLFAELCQLCELDSIIYTHINTQSLTKQTHMNQGPFATYMLSNILHSNKNILKYNSYVNIVGLH